MNYFRDRIDNERLDNFFQNALIGIHFLNPERFFIYINEYELSLLGYNHDELIGKKRFSDIVIPEQKKRFEAHWNHILNKKTVQNMEYTLVCKSGQTIDILLNAAGIFNNKGELINTRGIIINISQRKNLERMIQRKNIQLDIANKKLHEKNRLKSEFISKAAHELRTPLTSIIGFAQTLLMDDIELSPQEHSEFLKMILSEGKRLNTLISDMMDLSKIELGIISLQYERFNLVSIIKEAVNIFQETNHFPVNFKTDENLPSVYADKNRLKQVIMNVLNNAYLYGKNGSDILITLKSSSDSIVVGIHDKGPGISTSDLPHLFDKFYRGRTTDKTRGSGLGLPISKEIIETHGGKLWIQSTPGKGTSVFFSIPVQNHGETIN